MFMHSLAVFLTTVCLGSDAGPRTALAQVATSDGPAHAIVRVSDADGAQPTMVVKPLRKRMRSAQGAPAGVPEVWIGVNLAPLPEPLAAHIGQAGLMVSNVIKGSPADEAGLERFDVIVGLNGQKLNDMDGLRQAISAVGSGKKAELEIIRGSKSRQVSIKPAKRPDGEVQYKYDEPTDFLINVDPQVRGHRLFVGPGGWNLQDLGVLKDLPDELKELELLTPGMDFEFKLPDFNWLDSRGVGTSGACAKVEMQFRIAEDDGSSISVKRNTEGQLDVTRVDADGNETTNTYEDFGKFHEAEPDIADRVAPYLGPLGGGPRIRMFHADPNQLPQLRDQFQKQLQTHLGDLQGLKKRIAIWNEQDATTDDAGNTRGHGLSITIDGDKGVTVIREVDGQREVKHYGSLEELQQAEPEIFEKIHIDIGGAGEEDEEEIENP